MCTLLATALLLSLWLTPSSLFTQELDSQKRVQEILASLNKKKHKVKEKFGVRKEKYKEIRSDPIAKKDIRDYSGTYEVPDLGYTINIQVRTDGKIEATGYEPKGAAQQARRFTLEDARIESALLTATKVYDDGRAEKFEGVFINRTVFNSPTDSGTSAFGLVVIGQQVEVGGGIRLDKLFYQLRQ